MNERIRELAEQAEWRFADKATGNFSEYDQRLEKFAELIVLECANLTLDYRTHDHYMGWLDHGEAIVEHFGVKR